MDPSFFSWTLAQRPGFWPVRLATLGDLVKGDWERLWRENPPRINSELKLYLREARAHYSPAKIEKALAAHSTRLVLAEDPGFPALLAQIPTPPLFLYVKGDIDAFSHEPMVAIVGTRKISAYGKNVTE